MDFRDLVQKRRSIRKYTETPLTEEEKQTILRAGLMAPTGHGYRAWQFVATENKTILEALSKAKDNGAEFIASAPYAVAVAYDTTYPTWVEDAAIAAVTMQYQATDLGLGSCWAQVKDRSTADGETSSQYLRKLLGLNENMEVVCILAFGHPAIERRLQDEDKLSWNSVKECR